jgi:hypothetical protein
MYTVVQFGSSLLQVWSPRLSYETVSSSTSGGVISLGGPIAPRTVSFTFTIRNDGLEDSGAVFASVRLVSGTISGWFSVDYQNGFNPLLSDAQSYDYDYFAITGATSPIIPSGTSFGYSTSSQFYVNVNNIPALSYISLVFKVSLVNFSLYYPAMARANVTAISQFDYPIVENTQSFKLESELRQFFFVAYLTILVVAVTVGAIATEKDWPIGRL